MPHARDDYRILLEDLYVDRSMALIDSEDLKNLYIPFRRRSRGSDDNLFRIGRNDRRYVLIGNPGAGKSTFVRHLMYEICRSSGTAIGYTPLIVELKSYSAEKPKAFHEIIANRLRYMDQIDVKPSVIADILVLGYGLVVFDGLDEISNLSLRRDAVLAIESFCRRYPLTRVVVTSRPEGYSGAPLNPLMFSAYRLPDFSESQVVEYVSKWFQATRGTSGLDSSSAAKGSPETALSTLPICALTLSCFRFYAWYIDTLGTFQRIVRRSMSNAQNFCFEMGYRATCPA